MLIIRIDTASAFREEFRLRERHKAYSYMGFDALFEYIEERSDDCGQPEELDVISICCEWTEYDTLAELADQYGIETLNLDGDPYDDDDLIEQLNGRGTVLHGYDGDRALFSEG